MNFWSVFVTGLLAGGASCAVVQGGFLAGAVARRHGGSEADRRHLDDALPVGGFLLGKLTSHTLLGAFLGAVGGAAQLGFRARAVMQIGAGVLMVLMAAHLVGVSGLRRLVPSPPPRLARLVRRSAHSTSAAGPAILGFLTVLIPCGVTLSVMALAVASGSPLTGAVGMAIFVLGTSPLFAALGYAVRRSGKVLRGYLGRAAAVAVAVAGLLSINSGLVLSGSPVTLEDAWGRVTRDDGMGDMAMGDDRTAAEPGPGTAQAVVTPEGVQRIVIEVRNTSFSPTRVAAQAGVPTRLVLRTNKTNGCTRTFVMPGANRETALPETGDTELDLGTLSAGRIDFTCGIGMYRGVIEVS